MGIAENSSRASRERKEVVVVGGSGSGFVSPLLHVAKGGHSVRVLESKPTLDPAPRTLIVTDHFKSQISVAARGSILNEIRRFELFTDGRSAQVALKQPDLIIERSEIDSPAAQPMKPKRLAQKIEYDTRFHGLKLPTGMGLRVHTWIRDSSEAKSTPITW